MAQHEQAKRHTKPDEATGKASLSKPALSAQTPIVALQRIIGNQAVQRLIQREDIELPEDTIYGTPPGPAEGSVTEGEPTFDYGSPSSGNEEPFVDMDASDGSITFPPDYVNQPQSSGSVTEGEPTFDYGSPSSGNEEPFVDMDASDGSITFPPDYVN